MKTLLKKIACHISTLLIAPLCFIYAIMTKMESRDSAFWSFSQFLSLFPGKIGTYLRNAFYAKAMTSCHQECAILFGTIFSQQDTEIGKGVYIGPNCNIGKSRIENHCTLGSNVHILSGKNQHFHENLDIPIQEQGGVFEKIVIGEDTWIGNGALIMANIGKKCIIGAGSVVVHDVEDYAIVAGNPARLIRKRTPHPDT